jgi:hypothetical protein
VGLEERHAVASGTEQELRQEIDALRAQLASQAKVSERDSDAFVIGDTELSPARTGTCGKSTRDNRWL